MDLQLGKTMTYLRHAATYIESTVKYQTGPDGEPGEPITNADAKANDFACALAAEASRLARCLREQEMGPIEDELLEDDMIDD